MDRSPLDLDGYGPIPPDPKWPDQALVAVQVAVYLDEAEQGASNPAAYEYGARAGFWRLHRLLTQESIPVTVFGNPAALARLPRQVTAMHAAGWEIAPYITRSDDLDEDTACAFFEDSIATHQHITGAAPNGCATNDRSSGTVAFAAAPIGLGYVSHSDADDLPYWLDAGGHPQLVIPEQPVAPYDPKQAPDAYLKDLQASFDAFKDEGAMGHPKMMTIRLRPGTDGQAGRAAAVSHFLKHTTQSSGVWFATRADIASHWQKTHPAPPTRFRPSTLSGKDFVDTFGQVYTHAPWIAEQAWEGDLTPAHDTAEGLHSALFRRFRAATLDQRLAVLHTQPSCLTQQAAPHFSFDESETARIADLCADYCEKHGFPFVLADLDHSKIHLFDLLEAALANETTLEIKRACCEIETLARDRVAAIFEHHQHSAPD